MIIQRKGFVLLLIKRRHFFRTLGILCMLINNVKLFKVENQEIGRRVSLLLYETKEKYSTQKEQAVENVEHVELTPTISGFSLGRLHMGGGGTSAGGQSVNGGNHEGGHRPYREDLTLIDYIIN